MSAVQIRIPAKLVPLFEGKADVRAAHGGRGSAKTRTFAKMSAVRGAMWAAAGTRGVIVCGRQYMNSLADSSFAEVAEAIRSEPWLNERYEIGEKFIRTRDRNIEYLFSGLERNTDSIKSTSRILLCWVDEAEPITKDTWNKLEPTIREEGSELWVTWNPQRKTAEVETRYRKSTDPLIKCVEMNWRDNPWFPSRLHRQRERDLLERPDTYPHVWEGDYATVIPGAYFTKELLAAKHEGRITRLAVDPLFTRRVWCDLGGTGMRADAFAMWAGQIVRRELRFLKYYEERGQDMGAHLDWLRRNKYEPSNTTIYLPHDGATNDRVVDVSFESAFQAAGYTTDVIPNQGRGAARMRIEAMRRVFPSMLFDEEHTLGGREALAFYHEKMDDKRDIGLGPDHDWSSHGADAAGLAAIVYEKEVDLQMNRNRPNRGVAPPRVASRRAGY